MPRFLTLLPLLALTSQAADPAPAGRVALGAYLDRFSDQTGTWRGQFVAVEGFPAAGGPWSASLARALRPEGTGTTFMVAKEWGIGEASWIWGGLNAGSGADFVPRARLDLDSNWRGPGPWGVGVGGFWSRFSDGARVAMVQAGPSWTGGWGHASARVQRIAYGDGGGGSTGMLAELRLGADKLGRWHDLRLAWGEGILDAFQPGGSLSALGAGSGTATRGRGKGAGGSAGGYALPGVQGSPTEFLATSATHLPLTRRLAVQAELGWGRRDGQFKLWTGSLQLLVAF